MNSQDVLETNILQLYLLGQELPIIESYAKVACPISCSYMRLLLSSLCLLSVNRDDYSTYLTGLLQGLMN